MADQPPPPPPPPHGQKPQPRPPGAGLPDGNYDIFIIPPHSAGAGFVYLPSMQPHRNSFLLGVASTLLGLGVWTLAMPVLRQWFATLMQSGGVGVLALVVGVGVAGWAWGKTQGESGRGPGPGGGGSGAGAGQHREQKQHGWRERHEAGPQPNGYAPPPQPEPQPAPPPPPPPPPPPEPKEEEPPPPPPPEPKEEPKPEPPPPPPPQPKPSTPRPASGAASGWEKAREETRKREEERKRAEDLRKKREEMQRMREEAERAAKAKAEKEKWEQARAREKEQREREARERIARERLAKEKEAREKDAREREAREKDAREREAREKEAKEREAREKDAREREAREKAAKEKAEKDKAAAAAAAAAPTPPKPPPSRPTTSSSRPATSRYEKPTAASYVASDPGRSHSFRPYDKPAGAATYKSSAASSVSGVSESSYAPSQSTARTTPPPSHRGAYATKDPDKIQIKAVYLFSDSFPNKPIAQLIANEGSVTDGLILRIKSEGLFIDDDVRGVPQREWDVKAWTLKHVEDGVLKNSGSNSGDAGGGGEGLHVLRATTRDAENKRYTFVLGESEAWKVAVGLQGLRKGSQVRALGVNGMKEGEIRGLLGGLGWL